MRRWVLFVGAFVSLLSALSWGSSAGAGTSRLEATTSAPEWTLGYSEPCNGCGYGTLNQAPASGGSMVWQYVSVKPQAMVTFTVPAGEVATATFLSYRSAGTCAESEYQVDGGTWTTFASSGTEGFQVPLFSAGGLSAGSHSVAIQPTATCTAAYFYVDALEVATSPAATTTTTAALTTTTTGAPTTTTTGGPTSTSVPSSDPLSEDTFSLGVGFVVFLLAVLVVSEVGRR